MLWFSVWTVLVLATLAGAVVLGRRIYRSGRALLAELGRASDLLGQVADRAAELSAATDDAPLAPVDLVDPAPARARRELTAAATERRRAARAERHEAARARWRSFSR